ncbi:phosphodiester glycosidase family protein [Archangium violaceum]|uniref:phosphodiester glycosidase family protein n=1 Tax=Archangium violaceum TaxID=83451 RepID=UPI0036D8729E
MSRIRSLFARIVLLPMLLGGSPHAAQHHQARSTASRDAASRTIEGRGALAQVEIHGHSVPEPKEPSEQAPASKPASPAPGPDSSSEVCPRGPSPLAGKCPAKAVGFNVEKLPSTIELEGGVELEGIKGYLVTVAPAVRATYVVPDGSALPVDCTRLRRYMEQVCNEGHSSCADMRKLAEQCETAPPTCEALSLTSKLTGRALRFPLYTLEEWDRLIPTRLKVNANWFDVGGVASVGDIPNYPHNVPCSDIFGLSVSEGHVVSGDNPDIVGDVRNDLDALVVRDVEADDGRRVQDLQIVEHQHIPSFRGASAAVGGFILMKDGRVKRLSELPSSVKGNATGARTAIGLSQDRNTLYIMVVQGGDRTAQMTARQITLYLKARGAYDVMSLDNSGSSQLVFEGEILTQKGDKDQRNNPVYRPIPNFFGIE